MTAFDLPIPAGAVAGDWSNLTSHPDDNSRVLTWSLHDVAQVRVAVEGEQYADGQIERQITLYPHSGDVELTAAGARQLAAALLDAADTLEALQ